MLIYEQIPFAYRHPLRNARWIGISYLGLLAGGISPRLMGLTGINWFASLSFGLVLIGGVLVVLVIVRSVMAFSSAPAAPAQAEQLIQKRDLSTRYTVSLPASFLDLGAEEFHLAFLRSAFWEILLTFSLTSAQAGYWAAWAALLIALPETLHYHSTYTQRLCKCALLITTTVLFLFTRNLWLSWLLHLLGWTLLAPASMRHNR